MCEITDKIKQEAHKNREEIRKDRRLLDHNYNMIMEAIVRNSVKIHAIDERMNKEFNLSEFLKKNWKTVGFVISMLLSTLYYYASTFDNLVVNQKEILQTIKSTSENVKALNDEFDELQIDYSIQKQDYINYKDYQENLREQINNTLKSINKKINSDVSSTTYYHNQ